MFEITKDLCERFIAQGVPGIDLMVMQHGKEILRYKTGYSDLANKTPIAGNERYNIFSCSKPITCTALMQLWEKGLFSLDDPLYKYMPEYEHMTVRNEDGTIVPAETTIYIHNLFSMTAGFNYDLFSPSMKQLVKDTDGRCPTREVARYLAREPLSYQPGDRYQYSLGHDVLAALLEVLTGQKFADYVKEHIFEPLGMHDSDFLLPMEDYVNMPPLYFGQNGTVLHPRGQKPIYRLGSEHASGGAGCVSTVEDYMKFLEALREGEQLLKRSTIDLMTTDRLTDHQKRTFPSRAIVGYGLGMRCPKAGGDRVDFGWGGAAGAHLAVDIPHGISLYHSQHMVLSPNHNTRARVYLAVLDDLYGTDLLAQAEKADLKSTDPSVTK